MKSPNKTRGMALLVVLLILSVMVVIAVNMSSRMQLELRRASNFSMGKQATWYALGAEAMVKKILSKDFKDNPNVVNLDQNWARKGMTFPLDEATLTGEIVDLQACFNINSLAKNSSSSGGSGGDTPQRPYAAEVLLQLLLELEIEEYTAEQITDSLRDWIDRDESVLSSEGAEDSYYEGLAPPYLAANQKLNSLDELRSVRGITPDIYYKIAPHLCVLPNDKLLVNVNTLQPYQAPLLVALYLGKIDRGTAESVLADRPEGGWTQLSEFLNLSQLASGGANSERDKSMTITSDFFAAYLIAEVAGVRARQVTTLMRQNGNQIKVIKRLQDSAEREMRFAANADAQQGESLP